MDLLDLAIKQEQTGLSFHTTPKCKVYSLSLSDVLPSLKTLGFLGLLSRKYALGHTVLPLVEAP